MGIFRNLVLATACAFALAACSTAPNGDLTVAGIDTHLSGAGAAAAQADAQAILAALPQVCNDLAAGAAISQAELAVAGSVVKVAPKTTADWTNLTNKVVAACAGTAAVVAPLAN